MLNILEVSILNIKLFKRGFKPNCLHYNHKNFANVIKMACPISLFLVLHHQKLRDIFNKMLDNTALGRQRNG